MKFLSRRIAGGLLVLAFALVCRTVQADDVIESVPNGYINWTRCVLVIKGHEPAQAPVSGQACETLAENRTAAQNLRDSLQFVRMDSSHSVTDLITFSAGLQAKIDQMVAAAPVINQIQIGEGRLETAVQFQLTGGFAQLMLPATIEQVQSIKPINGAAGGTESEIDRPIAHDAAVDPDIYTGLVVDARGIGAKPSLVPIITDENSQDVYSPAFVSRDFAVRNGVCGYARHLGDEVMPRVGSKPLVVKGLRTLQERPSDIVISEADASRLRGASTHLRFLRQCRVMIILD